MNIENVSFAEYQDTARSTAIYTTTPSNKIVYPALGLAGETGEVCEKVKKVLRDSGGVFSEEKKAEIKKELGDVLWYISNLASDLDLKLEDIARANLEKLLSRKERGVLQGSGDNR